MSSETDRLAEAVNGNCGPHRGVEANSNAAIGPTNLNRPLGSIRPQFTPASASTTRGVGNTAIPPSGRGVSLLASGTTRTGAPRMVFQPYNPTRRKPAPGGTATDDIQPPIKSDARGARGSGYGRTNQGPSSRGRGRGELTMVASGPFAMGPAASGNSSSFRRSGGETFTLTGLGNSRTTIEAVQGLPSSFAKKEDQGSEGSEGGYSVFDGDEGELKIDMRYVEKLDWSAPVALKQEAREKRSLWEQGDMNEQVRSQNEVLKPAEDGKEAKEAANALDLSASEGEEEEEDITRHFARRDQGRRTASLESSENLYLFQFPSPFPKFTQVVEFDETDAGGNGRRSPESKPGRAKTVSWASSVKPEGEDGKPRLKTMGHEDPAFGVDGVIGQMEVYSDGEVKIRLGENILLTVKASSPVSFLEQLVEVDMSRRRMHGLGQIAKKFIAQPDIETLLDAISGVSTGEPKIDPSLEGLEAMEGDQPA